MLWFINRILFRKKFMKNGNQSKLTHLKIIHIMFCYEEESSCSKNALFDYGLENPKFLFKK